MCGTGASAGGVIERELDQPRGGGGERESAREIEREREHADRLARQGIAREEVCPRIRTGTCGSTTVRVVHLGRSTCHAISGQGN